MIRRISSLPHASDRQVFLAGGTRKTSNMREIAEIKCFANEQNCDIVVLNKSEYKTGDGKYDTLLVQTNAKTLENTIIPKTFDFKSMCINDILL